MIKRFLPLVLALALLTACATSGGSGSGSAPQSGPAGEAQSSAAPLTAEQAEGYALVADLMSEAQYRACLDSFGGQIPNRAFPSPQGGRALLWYSEFEEAAPWFVWDAAEGRLLTLPVERQPASGQLKSAAWVDESGLLLVVGGLYGTVAPGGDLYRWDLLRDPVKIYANAELEQTISVSVSGSTVLAQTARFDAAMEHYEVSELELPLVSRAALGYPECAEGGLLGFAESRDPAEWAKDAVIESYDWDQSGEVLYIVPRLAGSSVAVRAAEYRPDSGELLPGDTAAFYPDTADGFVLRLQAVQPECLPELLVVIEHGESRSTFAVAYDGRGESPYRLMPLD